MKEPTSGTPAARDLRHRRRLVRYAITEILATALADNGRRTYPVHALDKRQGTITFTHPTAGEFIVSVGVRPAKRYGDGQP